MTSGRDQEFNSACTIDLWLVKNSALSAVNRTALAETLSQLIGRINTDRKTTIGISGAPGSGKSTLSRALVHCLNEMGAPACRLSLDDYYLGRAERERLAEHQHPLFRQRGVPGTHELDRLLQDHDRIRAGEINGLRLPVFDKSIDDRIPESQWRTLEEVPQIIIIEGWCVGAMPQVQAELAQPVNAMEQLQDEDGAWRNKLLQAWRHMYLALRSRLDQVWYIRVPDWECVIDWRWQQEQELEQRNLDSPLEVQRFLACFERIVTHMQRSHSDWADLTLKANRNHDIHLP